MCLLSVFGIHFRNSILSMLIISDKTFSIEFVDNGKLLKNAWSFTQNLTQNLSQSIWSIQLDDLLNYGRWEDNSISRLSCVTQFMTNLTNMISRTFLGSLVWHKYDIYDISNISISRSVSVMWRVHSFSY